MHHYYEVVRKNRKGDYEAIGEYIAFDHEVKLHKITMWERKKRRYVPLYHTSKGILTPLLTLEAIGRAHEPEHELMDLDTVNLVMIPNIREVKDIHGALRAFFDDYNEADSGETTISKPKRKFIEHLIKKIKG